MTDKKLSDNEIIKVLEPFKSYFLRRKTADTDWTITIGDVLDLINRQKAEIEKLEAMIDAAEEHFAPLPFKNKFDEYIEKSKSEAIKEFAERLKEKAYTNNYCQEIVLKDDIDNIVKELVGE